MLHEEKIEFQATVEGLSEILAWIHQKVVLAPLSDKEKMQFEVALEEAVVNVVMHAYGQKGGRLQAIVALSSKSLSFTLIDTGIAFDPVSAPLKEEVPIEEILPGGLGVVMMRKYTDSLSYSREGDCNILTLVKNFTFSSQ